MILKNAIWLSFVLLALAFNACESTVVRENRSGESIVEETPAIHTPQEGEETVETPGTFHPVEGNVTGADENVTIKIASNQFSIQVSPEFDTLVMGQTQKIHYEIKDFFTGKAVSDDAVEKIVFSVDNDVAEFIRSDGAHGSTLTLLNKTAKAVSDVAIKSKSQGKSGQLNLNFTVKMLGREDTIPKSFPIVVEKNKSSSMAIVPTGSRYEKGLFIDSFVIHVVDSYGNKAKDGTRISTGVVNNPKLYSSAYNGGTILQNGNNVVLDDQTLPTNTQGKVSKNAYLVREFSQTVVDPDTNESTTTYSFIFQDAITYTKKSDRATLHKNGATLTLATNGIDTTKETISSLDTMIILANQEQHKPENLGGWDIASIDTNNSISLYDVDAGKDVAGVSYVIGDEYRYDRCNETIMNAAASTFTSTEVKDGVAYAELRYVPAMVGKNIFIYANSKLDDKRIGISRKVLLTGTGLQEATFSCKNEEPEGSTRLATCSERFRMIQKDSNAIAKDVYVAQPTVSGDSNYMVSTITRTDCDGWATVRILGVPVGKSATVKFGDFISDELIRNQR